jgi:CRISPR-associated endonuclease Csn1
VFCGQQMPLHQVFGQEGLFEIEHLLPFSRSFNDNMNNKVLSCRACNRRKAERSPFEAFGATPEWPEIWQRAQCLAGKKAWRFQPDAWEQSKGRGEDVIARLLNDTKYLSRMAREYLAHICPDNRIWVIPGQMTAMLRGKWGLNGWLGDPDNVKERKDHRHHAIDAFVVTCTDRATLQRISRAAEHRAHRARLIEDMPPPFPGFDYAAGKQLFHRIVVSHKPDHGGAFRAVNPPAGRKPYTVGRLHEETAYGLAEDQGGDKLTLVKREAISSFEKMKDLEAVRDACWRKRLLEHMRAVPCDEKGKPLEKTAWAAALSDFAARHRVRRLRVLVEKTRETVIGIRQPQVRNDPQTEPFKYYATGSNYCADIYCPDKGPLAGKWQIEVISTFRAHQKNFIPEWKRQHPTARLVMRLHNNDMVAYENNEGTVYCRVKKMTGGRVYLRPHAIAQEDGDKLSWAASPNLLQQKQSRKISVDILGRIKDPVAMQAQAA